MSWRVVVVSSNAKVDYKMDYITVRTLEEKGLRSAVMEAVIAAGEMSAAMSKEGAK